MKKNKHNTTFDQSQLWKVQMIVEACKTIPYTLKNVKKIM